MQLKYKAYLAEVSYSAPTGCFYGEVVSPVVSAAGIIFLASSKQTLATALQLAVEQYEISCCSLLSELA